MENFKIKMLNFGLYGTTLSSLKEEEIDLCIEKDYIEIYQSEDKIKLNTDLNGDSIQKITKNSFIKKDAQFLSARIKFYIFKESLKRYKFKDMYPYKVIDLMLTNNEFVSSTDICEICKIDSKRLFYVIKKLKMHDLLINRKVKHKFEYKLKKENLFSQLEIEKKYDKPCSPQLYIRDIPIMNQIKYLLDNHLVGITSKDIKDKLGISVKTAFRYLSRCVELNQSYQTKEIFIGKIRRFLFFRGSKIDGNNLNSKIYIDKNNNHNSNTNISNTNNQNYVTVDSRIEAINKMLEPYKYFICTYESRKYFQQLTRSCYEPCKKTIFSTALKAGHKIYFLKEKNETQTLILHKSTTLEKYFEIKNKDIPLLNKLEQKFYNEFVFNKKFVLNDNFYIFSEKERHKKIYEFLLKNSENNLLVFDKFKFDNLPLNLAFQIFPVEIPDLIKKIDCSKLNLIDLFNQKIDSKLSRQLKLIFQYKRFVKYLCDLKKNGILQIYIYNEDRNLNSELNIVDSNVLDNTDIKYNNKSYHKYNLLKDMSSIKTSDTLLIKLIKEPTLPKKKIKKDLQIKLEERLLLLDIVKREKKDIAYIKILKYIQQIHPESYSTCKFIISNIFGPIEINEIQQSSIDEYLYTKIKKDLLIKNKLEYEDYSEYNDIDITLRKLNSDNVIVKTTKHLTIKTCALSTKYKPRLLIKGEVHAPKKYIERDTIYSIYFHLVYDLLLQNGSLEFNEILLQIKVCKDYELKHFLNAYSDVFEVNEIDKVRVVSLKLDIDPFSLS